jgi:hypothetical protein
MEKVDKVCEAGLQFRYCKIQSSNVQLKYNTGNNVTGVLNPNTQYNIINLSTAAYQFPLSLLVLPKDSTT